jgi:heme oxygenase
MPPAAVPTGLMSRDARHAGLRYRLRDATADAHARLDAQLETFDLRQLSDYRRFLEISAAALLPLEAALVEAGVERVFPDWPSRSRTRALLADLDRTGGVARPLPAPDALDFAGILGTMYVLEGSRLGARLLLEDVLQSSDAVVAGATAYLGHGAGRPLWQSFVESLERHAASLDEDTRAIAGARRAFGLFEDAVARTYGTESTHP